MTRSGPDDGFWQTPPRAGGSRLLITVTGLPAGTHQVYLRYFTQPRLPGNPWWFILLRGLEGGRKPSEPDRIIAGTGGHDPRTVYETHMGTVGTDEQPATQVTLWIERYEWSELGRFGSIRIETDPSMNASTTAEVNPANERVRAALLANGPKLDGEPAYGTAVVSGTLKVRPKSFAALADQPLPAEISMAAAKGEYESRQVLLYSPDRDLVGVTLECSSLKGDRPKEAPTPGATGRLGAATWLRADAGQTRQPPTPTAQADGRGHGRLLGRAQRPRQNPRTQRKP